jgi:xanthine/CO dehydrogenase XdhC/CoxF family maturation factor
VAPDRLIDNRLNLTGEAMNSFGDREEILKQAIEWRDSGKGVALATVVTTWGLSPRPVGSKLAVDDAGNFVGSVSGGCIEGAVVHEALDAIKSGKPRLLDFGVSNEQAWEVGLACGGKVQVFVERVE